MKYTLHSTILRFAMCMLTICCTCLCRAQNSMTWEDFVNYMHNEEDEGTSDFIFEELQELHINPLNINLATEEELAVLPFLTTNQIRDIIYYRDTNGEMYSLGELMFIGSLDKFAREALMLFCHAGSIANRKPSLSQIIKNARSELVARTDVPLYKKAGFSQYPDSVLMASPNKVYLGTPPYTSLHYKMQSMNRFEAGIQAEKDVGENDIDYVTGYAMLHDVGCIKNAIVGNYRVSFGQGLVVNTGSSFGKMMMLNGAVRMDRGITRHSSTSETGYFTGVASTIKLKDWKLSTYVSSRNLDGTMNNDGSGITTIKTDGYHRTMLERSKKGNVHATDMGANIHWDNDHLQLSATMASTHFSVPLSPKCDTPSSWYRLYNAKGSDFMAYSLSYAYRTGDIAVTGETASGTSGGIATINTMTWSVNSYNSITLLQRYYSYKYVTINGKCFSENASPQNEDGIYIGWNANISRKMKLTSYIDGMYFPWLKYQVSGSSYGMEGGIDINYTPTRKWNLSVRYKIKTKQKDYVYHFTDASSKKDTLRFLQYNTKQNIRFVASYSLSEHLTIKTTINGTMLTFGPNANEYGYSIGEAVQWADTERKIRANFSCTYFHTDSYDTRIYNYEAGLLHSFGMMAYYYHGIRLAALASVPISRNLFITGKMGITKYFNKTTIGSGLDLINANHKEDVQMQMRWKF